MKKIYAVNSGSYSDYRVVALFSTPERAQEFMAAVPDSDYNGVEEFELNPDTADLIKRGYSLWLVHMLRDGNTERVEQLKLSLYDELDDAWTMFELLLKAYRLDQVLRKRA